MSADFDNKGHEKGAKAPFPPVWKGDPWAGHHKSCGARIRTVCTCGYDEYNRQIDEQMQPPNVARMPVAAEYLQERLCLPADVHIIGVEYERIEYADAINVIFVLEAFSDSEFPGRRVNAQFINAALPPGMELDEEIRFVGWEAID